MSEKHEKHGKVDIEEIAEKAERGEDVSQYFTGKHIAKQRVNIDFPLSLLRKIDMECKRVGVTRQSWIKMTCAEKLQQIQRSRKGKTGEDYKRLDALRAWSEGLQDTP